MKTQIISMIMLAVVGLAVNAYLRHSDHQAEIIPIARNANQ